MDSTTIITTQRDLFTRQECISLDLYTPAQEHFLAIVPYFSAPWSLIGSSLILWAIWYDRKVCLNLVYHRLMFAMSLMDWLNSFGMLVFGPWAVPADYEYGRAGRGNDHTCTASGFFFNMLTGAINYSAFLSLSFLMTIRWEWKERRIACCMEPLAHFFGFLGPTINVIIAAVDGLLNPLWELPGWCWFSDNPPFCASDNVYCMNDGTLILPQECERGQRYAEYTSVISVGHVIFVWSIIVLCMVAIILKVLKMERSLQQYGDATAGLARTRETANQALLYIGAFMVSFLPFSILTVLTDNSDDPLRHGKVTIFIFAFLTKFTASMIGFFNAWIYFRNRFKILIREGQSLAFLTQIPWLGPWIVARVQAQGRSRTGTTSNQTQTGSVTNRRYSSALNMEPVHETNDKNGDDTGRRQSPETFQTEKEAEPTTMNNDGPKGLPSSDENRDANEAVTSKAQEQI